MDVMDNFITQQEDVFNSTYASDEVVDPWAFRPLSATQKTILAVLPIPSAILSIIGSSVIIYMAYMSKKSRSWTPYNRLLVAMSIYDIISSIALASAAFMNDKQTSNKAWAMGNDSTCSTIGFLNQISYSGTLYNAALSYYFLFTARFGMKNDLVARRIEPTMHVISVGFPMITGFVGLYLGVYSESETNLGCWVNRYPKRCAYGPDGTGEPCLSGMIGWIFGGWIGFFTLFSLIINNFVIWIFARGQMKKAMEGRSPSVTIRTSTAASVTDVDEESKSVAQLSMASSLRTGLARMSSVNSRGSGVSIGQDIRKSQQKRLRLVTSQAFLFVASYIVSSMVSYILRYIESQATSWVEEMELTLNFYILMVLQAILLPLQGLFNMMVYIRPKYLKNRSDFSRESRIWALRRSILGAKVEPVHSLYRAIDIHHDSKAENNSLQKPLDKDMISSLTTGSAGGNDDDDDRVDRARSQRRVSGPGARRSNSLEVISESAEQDDGIGDSDRNVKMEPSAVKEFSINSFKSGPVTILMDGTIVQNPKLPTK